MLIAHVGNILLDHEQFCARPINVHWPTNAWIYLCMTNVKIVWSPYTLYLKAFMGIR